MSETEILEVIAKGETLGIEFKSDRNMLSDRALVEAVVALSNSDGGLLLLGVEDATGEVTGLHPRHRGTGTPAALIANRTIPSLHVDVTEVSVRGVPVFVIEVPRAPGLVGTSDGYYARRRIKPDGAPESVPMNPFEIQQRMAYLRLVDFSAQPMPEIALSERDPLQRERMRATIRQNRFSDKALLELDDEDFDLALGLVREFSGRRLLTLAGVLFLTNESVIREHVPTYETAFQVLSGTNVLVNEFSRRPLVEVFDDFEMRFKARVEEREVMRGLYRMSVPNYDLTGFREAVVNALVHRDYAQMGTVVVKLDDAGLSISNPGGFVEGVTLDNLMNVEPKPRNPLLADISKRIGLAERTGRGIDRIFEGTLRFGRPRPSYARSTSTSVHLFVANAEPDFAFLDLLNAEESRTGKDFPFHSLLILAALRENRRLNCEALAKVMQTQVEVARSAVEELVEGGIVEAQGRGSSREYLLSARVYKRRGQELEYVRQAGLTEIEREQMVLKLLKQKPKIKRHDVMELCHIDGKQATALLAKMCKGGDLTRNGERRAAFYVASETFMCHDSAITRS